MKRKSGFLKEKFIELNESARLFPFNIDQSIKDFQQLIKDIELSSIFLTSFYFSQTYSINNIQIPNQNIVKCDNSIAQKLHKIETLFLRTQVQDHQTSQHQQNTNLNQKKNKQLNVNLIIFSLNMECYLLQDNSQDKEKIFTNIKEIDLKDLRKDQIILYKSPTINNIYIQTLKIEFNENNQQGYLQKNSTINKKEHQKLNINQQFEFLLINSSDELKSDYKQEFYYEQIIQQLIQINQENTNYQLNNLNEQENNQKQQEQNQKQQQNQDNQQLLYSNQQILYVQKYLNQLLEKQNENEIKNNHNFDYEDHRNIEIEEDNDNLMN